MAETKKLDTPSEIKPLLIQAKEEDVVLDFAFYESPQATDRASHFYAAKLFLHKRHRIHIMRTRHKMLRHSKRGEKAPDELRRRYIWDIDLLDGLRITFDEFWGSDEIDLNPIRENILPTRFVDGYKSAFFWRPRNPRASNAQNASLFVQLNAELFGDYAQSSFTIYSWSTNCSDYFRSMSEDHSAFLWTAAQPAENRITLFAFSSR